MLPTFFLRTSLFNLYNDILINELKCSFSHDNVYTVMLTMLKDLLEQETHSDIVTVIND